MSFLNPFFLLGVAALAAPILVHLVRRTRARKVQFPALVFIRQVPQRTIRRRTLHNLFLLLLRCLAILLIVLAFTRPFFSGGNAAKTTSTNGATVVLIDTSLSMRREKLFANAQQRAEAIVDDARPGETLSILGFDKRYVVLNRFTADKDQLRAGISSAEAGWDGTDYEQALRGAESLLNENKTTGPRRIVLISDFHTAGWNAATASFKLGNATELQTIDVGNNNSEPNVAVTNVEARGVIFGQKYLENLAVHINNFSDNPRDRVQVSFQINDQTVEKREISLGSRDTRIIEFTGFNLAEGANRCAIEIGSDDFPHDNLFYFTLKRAVPAKGLIIEGATRGRSDSLYLQSALTTNDALPYTFTLKTTGAVDPSGVSEYSLVILNDAGPVSAALAQSLARFVEAGGQLIIAIGPHTDVNAFNASLGKISAVVLREVVQTKTNDTVAITEVKFDHPIFEIFRESGRLSSAQVIGYGRSEPQPNTTVLARYEDGSPTLIESRAGKGRVLLFTTSLGPSWNDLPLTPAYLPFVHQMIKYAGEREEGSWFGLGQTFTVKKDRDGSAPAIDTPGGARLSDTRSSAEGDTLVTAREPGFYRLRYSAQPDFAAINVDGGEGDFTKLNFTDFVAGVTGGAGNSEGGESNGNLTNEELEGRQRIWWSLLLLALLLLITESVLARRTKVVKMVG
jgi:von Willebrand factor type A domain/Aerotolerance regulator N-terminal